MRTLIIGQGEIGQALFDVLSKAHETFIRDVSPVEVPSGIQVLNICFPYTDRFIDAVKAYQEQYTPELTIIHSTVPPGVSRRLGAIHSPVHGRHKSKGGLVRGLLTFVKYIGAVNKKDALSAQRFLRAASIKTKIVDNPETSELSKILCTTSTALSAVFVREAKRMCDASGASFDQTYTFWRKLYNAGYKKLGEKRFIRPIFDYEHGPLGGHCCAENCELLPREPVMKFILERNATYAAPAKH